jgi:DNA-binding transcriptional ArsR family regulator
MEKNSNVKQDLRGRIDRPAQVRALISPTRQEIVDVLEAAGPCSIARLAELLHRPPDSLYFHVRRLLKVGLIIETERHKQGRHVFAVYDVMARPLTLAYEPPVRPIDVIQVVTAAVRLGIRDFRRSFDPPTAADRAVTGGTRQVWGGRAKGWVSPKQLAQVNHLISQLLAIVRAGEPAVGAKAISFSFVLAPASSSKRLQNLPLSSPSNRRKRKPRTITPRKKRNLS